jgi:eukaryotic-like serine/threonine-protein kinase
VKDLTKIEEIYHEALQVPPTARDAFLRDSCGDDYELHDEIKSLLFYDEQATDFIETPPEDLAAAFIKKQNESDFKGKIFNHYKIVEKLGAGGMGEVYLAEDTKLNRKVALKVLPLQFSQDVERRRRFEKEARAVSALNHPNIITIYGIEKADDLDLMVTELVKGVTLRERIAEKPVSPLETIEIGIQIADALHSAHSVGIIHRDIKPANIMIRRDGIVKVLDFGLAKLANYGGDSADFETREHTAPNGVMGTINYMSPEQALGETVDFRTDIFSLGVVFYEMLAGVKPFDGISDAAIYNATINVNPQSLCKLNPKIPQALEQVVFRTIAKKREDRYQTFSELSRDLKTLKENPNSNLSIGKSVTAKHKSNLIKIGSSVAAVLLISLVAYFLYSTISSKTSISEAKTFNYVQLTSQSGEELFPSLSPDGKSFIYTARADGKWNIFSQNIDGSNLIDLTKDFNVDNTQAVYSPSGKEIAFRSERDGGGIFVMDANGKNVRKISEIGFHPSWSPDGTEIVYCTDEISEPGSRTIIPSELWRVSASSGEKRLITKRDAVQPNWSPNNFRIAFWAINEGGQRDIWTVSANGDEPVAVTKDAAVDWNPVWSADGKYLYFASDRSGSMNLWRVAIDEKSGIVEGKPEAVTIPSNYSQLFNFSHDGNGFVYVQTVNHSNILKIDFNPTSEKIGEKSVQITSGSKITTNPNISPDGGSLIFDAIGEKQEDLFVSNANGSGVRQLTNDIYKDRAPIWSPDGKRLAFFTDSTGKYEGYVINADGGNRVRITQFPEGRWANLPLWSPDGKHLMFNTASGYPVIYDPDKDWTQQTPQFLPDEGDPKRWFMAVSWSPDGRKIIGYSRLTGNLLQSSIRTYDCETKKYEEVSDFGIRPAWLADSRRVIFYNRGELYLLDTKTRKSKEIYSVAPNRIQAISVSKDNRSIYYSLQKNESDIWLANTQ